jgi:heme A synthase
MRELRFACLTAGATFLLLLAGGLVHATGSSLACPDWPLCYGQLFPKMEGGILVEHGHRLIAGTVAVMTVVLCGLVFASPGRRRERPLALGAVGLVLLQAALGGVTVLLKLPLAVSTAHLATSMAFFSLLLWLAFRLRPALPWEAAAIAPRGLGAVAGLAVYAQLLLGALVRHTGSGLACNAQFPLCNGELLPAGGPATLHFAHRAFGVVVALLVIAASARGYRAAQRSGRTFASFLALLAPVLVLAQIALGAATVLSFISVPVVEAHLAAGAALLFAMVSLHLSLGPLGAPRPVAAAASAPSLAEATS